MKDRGKKNVEEKDNKKKVRGIDESKANDESAEEKAFAAEGEAEDAGLRKAMEDLEELRQTMLRRQADFDNYRKRIERERTEDSKRATARLIEGLIPILDGFEQALAAHREAEYESYRKGFELIYKQLMDNMVKLGVERVEPVGKTFDPHLHQAMDRTETTERADGTILQVFQPGYVFHGRVLRPAMVRVAVRPDAASKAGVN